MVLSLARPTKGMVPYGIAIAIAATPVVSLPSVSVPWDDDAEKLVIDGGTFGFQPSVSAVSPTSAWIQMTSAIRQVSEDASSNGTTVSEAARLQALTLAASLEVFARLSPVIVDNEEGGIVFYWKGKSREIQVELGADGTNFTRIRGREGEIEFEQESVSQVEVSQINLALNAWSKEQLLRPVGSLHKR